MKGKVLKPFYSTKVHLFSVPFRNSRANGVWVHPLSVFRKPEKPRRHPSPAGTASPGAGPLPPGMKDRWGSAPSGSAAPDTAAAGRGGPTDRHDTWSWRGEQPTAEDDECRRKDERRRNVRYARKKLARLAELRVSRAK